MSKFLFFNKLHNNFIAFSAEKTNYKYTIFFLNIWVKNSSRINLFIFYSPVRLRLTKSCKSCRFFLFFLLAFGS